MKSLQEEQDVSVNHNNEIKTLKKLLEEAKVEKASLKKKVVEWDEKYDKMKKRANEWVDMFIILRETDNPIIQELREFIEKKTKWRVEVEGE